MKSNLSIKLSLIVLIILVTVGLLTGVTSFIISSLYPDGEYSFVQTISVIGASVLAGWLLAIVISNIVLKPLNNLILATKNIMNGDFSCKVPVTWQNKYSFDEINQLISSFNDMSDELARNELFRNDFISNFSHEFKTPLVSIRGFAQQLYDGDLTPEQQKEFSKIILEEATYLSKLSTDILLLTSLENKNIVTEKTLVSLDEQLRTCMLMLEPYWEAKNLDIDMNLDEISIYQNESLLAHIWKNLIDNAVKFTPDNGSVRVSCRAEKDKIVVSVSDSGIGIEKDKIPYIFDKFYQGDKSHATKGNGLGLALVKRIVDLCEGTIRVLSTAGEGSEFIVELPFNE